MSDVVLSSAQEGVIARIHGLSPGSAMIVSGWAGVGKSICLGEAFKREKGRMVMCPTGKAAARLREIGIPARTIHSQLYRPRERQKGVLDWDLRVDDELPLNAGDLVFVDEASMVGPRIASDLAGLVERVKLRLVLVGDGFQLPPVLSGEERAAWGDSFSVMHGDGFESAERVQLTEIFRQALDSPVLRGATRIRQGLSAPCSQSEPAYVARTGDRVGAAKVLCSAVERGMDTLGVTWKNDDRHAINRAVRAERGHDSDLPAKGESLVVLANAQSLNLWNGEIVAVVALDGASFPLRRDGGLPRGLRAVIRRPDGTNQRVILVLDFLGGGDSGLTPSQLYSERFGIPPLTRGGMLCVDWGYCLTAHRSQGSEWSAVVLFTPNGLLSMPDWRRWAYTAMTRAKEGLVVVAEGGSGAVFEVGGRKLASSMLVREAPPVAPAIVAASGGPTRG